MPKYHDQTIDWFRVFWMVYFLLQIVCLDLRLYLLGGGFDMVNLVFQLAPTGNPEYAELEVMI